MSEVDDVFSSEIFVIIPIVVIAVAVAVLYFFDIAYDCCVGNTENDVRSEYRL
jgi:hypothetical protein